METQSPTSTNGSPRQFNLKGLNLNLEYSEKIKFNQPCVINGLVSLTCVPNGLPTANIVFS